MRSRRIYRLALAGLLLASCDRELAGPASAAAPEIVSVAVAPGPHNVLSLIVTTRVQDADSVAIRFRSANASVDEDILTLSIAVRADSAVIPVLGLEAEQTYQRALAWGPGGTADGSVLQAMTGALPSDLPAYAAGGPDPSPGYVVFAAGRYGLVTDNTGRVVWYRRFPNGPGLNFMAQPTGHYAVRPPTPEPGDVEPWLELDALGNITRTMDLTAFGGHAAARVTGTVVQQVGANGALLFEWSPFDHFAITDLDPAERTGVHVNWTHGNSLDIDGDGQLLVSFRSLGEITRIDRATGERYVIDGNAMTARLVASNGAGQGFVTTIGGSVQDLPGGRTLAAFGTAGRVVEYDADGLVVWSFTGNVGYVFRAQRIASLYAPGTGSAR